MTSDGRVGARSVSDVPNWGPGSPPPPDQPWSDILTDMQLRMVLDSGHDPKDGRGFGVELRGGKWKTARSLVRFKLGWIEGDPGGDLPGLYFNTKAGVAITHDFDDLADEPATLVYPS